MHLGEGDLLAELREDVAAGLAAASKELPAKWFYDEHGSWLFERITELPEYYLTRRELEILESRAQDVAAIARPTTLVELGAGTSRKTRLLLDAFAEVGLRRFVPLDVSETVLRESSAAIARAYPELEVEAVVADFEHHIGLVPRRGSRLVAFLGSTIGNLEPRSRARFLASVARALAPGERLLLGVDLVKDDRRLLAAYDDAEGVTAMFNLNVLAVINRELGADFDLAAFEHVAVWDAGEEWMEMRLRSLRRQIVCIAALEARFAFADGEELRTEISAKFRREGIEAELERAGFRPERWWTDTAHDFGVSLSCKT